MTILLQSDWNFHPTAIPDYQTTNRSFVRLAQLYHSMGVENYDFLLALHNPDLQGIDPFDENLTREQKIDIGIECSENAWYFFREVVRVPPQAGPNPVRLKANRGNIGLYWSFFNHIDTALIQPRQTGKSVSTDCLIIGLQYFLTDNTTITMITKDNDLRRKNVERLKKIRDLLPKYLLSLSPDDADNQVEITYKRRKNSYMTAVAQNNEAGANNVGRGLTSPILHSDEGPFTAFINIILPAALAAGTAARDEAEANGRPYGNIFTTTAGKKDSREGKFMYDMISGAATWDEQYFDSPDRSTLHKRVLENCPGQEGPNKKVRLKRLMFNMTLSHNQLGYDDAWLMKAISNAGGTPESIARDFLNYWSSGSLTSPLSQALNETIANSVRRQDFIEFSADNYGINWYIPKEELEYRMSTGRFVMGLDTSEAVGRDTIAMVIIDVETLAVVGLGTYNNTNLIRFSTFLCNLMIRYQNITMVPERKSTGSMMIDHLTIALAAAGQDPFKRIYNRIVDDASTRENDYRELDRALSLRDENFYDMRKSAFGFNTNAERRTLLYTTVLQEAARDGGHVVHSERLSQEIRSLVVKNDRIDHAASGHDDHVIAWLLAMWFITHARNLKHYGIDSAMVKREVVKRERRDETPAQRFRREEQERLMAEATALLERLSSETDAWVVAKLEGQLRALSGRLVSDDADHSYVRSIDAAIKESRETREKRRLFDGANRGSQGTNDGYRPINSQSLSFGTPMSSNHRYVDY